MDDRDGLVTLVRTRDEMAASLFLGALKEAGIRAEVAGGFTAGFRAEAPGYVDVVVRKKNLAEAQTVLRSFQDNEPIEWSKVDVGEPTDET